MYTYTVKGILDTHEILLIKMRNRDSYSSEVAGTKSKVLTEKALPEIINFNFDIILSKIVYLFAKYFL